MTHSDDRAKDLNGLLTLLRDGTHALNMLFPILARRSGDSELQCQTVFLRELRDRLDRAGRDLSQGLIDLREAPFDTRAWELLFGEGTEPLELGVPIPELPAWEVPRGVERTSLREELFDFDCATLDPDETIPLERR